MYYELSYSSPLTHYAVGKYSSVDACERDCETRYGVKVKFELVQGVWRATIYSDVVIVLTLHTVVLLHAS